MSSSSHYNTKQRERILSYLTEHADEHMTADDIISGLRAEDISIGRATVYRYLDRLAELGQVIKFSSGGGSACYQYLSHSEECRSHYHLRCKGCGSLIHCECAMLDELSRHIREHHSFAIDASSTVLFGMCDKCREGAV
ncbi:MAG: transcriptional repressor [Clostridia bacterium]|nr:transcriptional repressor [Clostridia bacterium]